MTESRPFKLELTDNTQIIPPLHFQEKGDLAVGRESEQSTIWDWSILSGNANDGNHDTCELTEGSVIHTADEANAWWKVKYRLESFIMRLIQ